MQILNERQIQQKIKRLAIQVIENNHLESELILIGINNTGMRFAEMLRTRLVKISAKQFPLINLKINPRNPLDPPIQLEISKEELSGKTILLVDDVANSGRTLFYACKPIMEVLPKKLETIVLVDRTHKSFPVSVNYFGVSLATTLRENITVKLSDTEQAVFLG